MKDKVTRVTLVNLMDKYLECHTFGHTWRWLRDKDILLGRSKLVVQYTEVLRCSRCTMKRLDTIAFPSMDLVRRSYDPPEGYYVERGGEEGRPHNRRDFKREAFNRRRNRLEAAAKEM
jgi:hypothetical protein